MPQVFPFSDIQIMPDSSQPIYLQIANQLKQMRSELNPDQLAMLKKEDLRLPSMRNFADLLQVAIGTIQQTYNTLEKEGIIYRQSGKGTYFNIPVKKIGRSRKEQANEVMDQMLQTLDNLHFSDREKQIYFDLKMRERDTGYHSLKVGIVDSSSEIRTILQNAISDISNLDLFRYPLDELAFSGADLLHDLDLIVTSIPCYERVNHILKSFKVEIEIAVLGLEYSLNTILQLAKLTPEDKVTLVAYSHRFARIMSRAVSQIAATREAPRSFVLSKEEDADLPDNIGTLIMPEQLMYFAPNSMQDRIKYFKRHASNSIDFEYVWQEGSLLYLQRIIDDLKQHKMQNKSK